VGVRVGQRRDRAAVDHGPVQLGGQVVEPAGRRGGGGGHAVAPLRRASSRWPARCPRRRLATAAASTTAWVMPVGSGRVRGVGPATLIAATTAPLASLIGAPTLTAPISYSSSLVA